MTKEINNTIKEELSNLLHYLIKTHPNPFHNISQEELTSRLNQLAKESKQLDKLTTLFKLMEIFVLINDTHTRVKGLAKYLSEAKYPIQIKKFDDGFYIVSTNKQHEALIGARILDLNGIKTEEIIKRFSKVLTHENEVVLYQSICDWIYEPDILKYLGIISNNQELTITTEDSKGNKTTETIIPTIYEDEELINPRIDAIKDIVTLRRNGLYWTNFYEDYSTYYIQYNECEDITEKQINEMINEIKQSKPKYVVVDLRQNIGGSSTILDPLTDYLYANQDSYIPVVLISDETFSAAIVNALNILDGKNAISYGTKTAGSPTKFGQATGLIELESLGVEVHVATKTFEEEGYDYGEPLSPQKEVKPTIEEYLCGKDVVWEMFLRDISQ